MHTYTCPNGQCGRTLRNPRSMVGKSDTCPACGQAHIVPCPAGTSPKFLVLCLGCVAFVIVAIVVTIAMIGAGPDPQPSGEPISSAREPRGPAAPGTVGPDPTKIAPKPSGGRLSVPAPPPKPEPAPTPNSFPEPKPKTSPQPAEAEQAISGEGKPHSPTTKPIVKKQIRSLAALDGVWKATNVELHIDAKAKGGMHGLLWYGWSGMAAVYPGKAKGQFVLSHNLDGMRPGYFPPIRTYEIKVVDKDRIEIRESPEDKPLVLIRK